MKQKSIKKLLSFALALCVSLSLAYTNKIVSSAASTRYEAESATTNGSIYDRSMASGGKSVGGLDWSGKYVQFTIYAASAGTYKIGIGFGTDKTASSTRSIYVNGVDTMNVTFPGIGSLNTFQSHKEIYVSLNAGNNTFKIQTDSADAATATIELDYIDVEAGTPPADYAAEPQPAGTNQATIYPAPTGAAASAYHSVWVNNTACFAYTVNTYQNDAGSPTGPVSYASFDFTGSVTVKVNVSGTTVTSAKVTPNSYGTKAYIYNNYVYFNVNKPGQYTLEVNGSQDHVLHIFANPPETNIPSASDPNVIYYGPGYYNVNSITLTSGKTLYIAGGAILHVVTGANDNPHYDSWFNKTIYTPEIYAKDASNVTIRGRGIVDLSGLTWGEKEGIHLENCSNVNINGIILAQTVHNGVVVRRSDHVTVDNVKVMGKEGNTDGIFLQGSQESTIKNCFVRTNDDQIYVNSYDGNGLQEPSYNDVIQNCVVWADRAHSLGIVYSIMAEVHDITFTDCDVLHSYGGDPYYDIPLAVFSNDYAPVYNIKFQNINVESSKFRFIQVQVLSNSTSTISNITFKNCRFLGAENVTSFINGCSGSYKVDGVTLQDCSYKGNVISNPVQGCFTNNSYAYNLKSVVNSQQYNWPASIGGGCVYPGIPYRIVNKNSGKSMEIGNQSTAEGVRAWQWDYSGLSSQNWIFEDAGNGYVKIKNANSNLYLDVDCESTADGAIIKQWQGTPNYNQQWQIVDASGYGLGWYKLVNRNSGKLIEIQNESTANGAYTQQMHDAYLYCQQWYLYAP